MKFGIVVFPGSNCDEDALYAAKDVFGQEADYLWHKDADLKGADVVILPGGFAHGDYLRTGAIARFSPVMHAVGEHARAGGPVVGICNGFQVLCEARLLPGALIRNAGLHFVCRDQALQVSSAGSAWTSGYADGQQIVIPVKHGEGRYVADEATLVELEEHDQIVFRYVGGNPNGSLHDIAGVSNDAGNVVGLMPHPEHAVEELTGPGVDGLTMFTSVLGALVAA
jgi:phosphoribosylformylglycinamidine synthase subunit PurQ / glutaminase